MEIQVIYQKMTSVFHDVFEDDNLQIGPELAAKDVDGWDSLNHIRLMLSVQNAFGIAFTAHEIGRLKNVGELVDLVRAKL